MDRSFRLIVFALLILVLVPLPLAMSAARSPRAGSGSFSRPLKRAGGGLKAIGKLFKLYKKPKKSGDELESSADSVEFFVFNLTVGASSPQNIPGVLDITSELVWSQCSPCSACLPAPAPVFQPDRSPTFARLPCGSQACQRALNQTCSGDDRCKYTLIYDEITNTTGYLANDTFTFGDTPVPVVFGCSNSVLGNFSNVAGASGFFGLSQGPLSLVTQLQLSWFSYYWASDDDGSDDSSYIAFGGGNAPQGKNSRSTPLLNSTLLPDLYSVKLTGIKVDGNDLAGIPAGTFDFRANGSGGVFLSTTIPLTILEQAAYNEVRKAIAGSIMPQPVNGSAIGLDLCYTIESLKNVKIPKLALVFGADAVMDLRRYNYFFADNNTGLECLSIMPFTGISVLGSFVQTGTNMTYDLDNARLIFDTTASQTAAASPAYSLGTMMLLYHLAVWVVLF